MSDNLTAYGTSPVKRKRRTNAELADVENALIEQVNLHRPMTIRQLFYRGVSGGFIDKTEQGYKAVCRIMGDLRRRRVVPFADIVDNTRMMRKPRTYGGVGAMLEDVAALYRRDLWRDADDYVEVWCEKDALTGVILRVTSEFDVPLMISRGFASLSFLHGAAETIESVGKPTTIYYLGDHDPSGLLIPQKIEATIRQFAPDVDLTFRRLAVTPWQIRHYDLPTRPTKQSDSRSKGFEGESVEVDAIEPSELRAIVRGAIESHVDPARLAVLRQAERSERESIRILATEMRKAEGQGDE